MDKGEYRISYEEGEVHFMAQAAISSAEHRLQPGVKLYYQPENQAPFPFTTDPRRAFQKAMDAKESENNYRVKMLQNRTTNVLTGYEDILSL